MDKQLEQLNEFILEYYKYLTENYIEFLENLKFFNSLNLIYKRIYEKFNLDGDKSFNYTKETMISTLTLVKKYFHDTYNGIYDEEIEKMITDGTIEMYYANQEENELWQTEEGSQCILSDSGHASVKLICYGVIENGLDMAHEIRHKLNAPENGFRNFTSDMITEALSEFEERKYLDYIENIYPKKEIMFIRKSLLYILYCRSNNFDFVSNLVLIYENLGKINLENCVMFTKKDPKEFEGFYEENIKKGAKLIIEKQILYILGIIVASYMHQKVIENPDFVSKIIEFNERLKKNPEIETIGEFLDFFKIIGLDINDEDMLEQYLSKEFEWLASLDEKEEITR